MAAFGDEERRIKFLLSPGNTFSRNGRIYKIEFSGKPTCRNGEPKTDIYVYAVDNINDNTELKISFKKENANFLENKTTAERAEQLFGQNWDSIITMATQSISQSFQSRFLVYKKNFRKTQEGSITLGWKFELMNEPGGDLSGNISMTKQQVIDVYSGTNLAPDKRDASVDGNIIKNSGVANYLLMNDSINSTQGIIDNLVPIQSYVNKYPNIYFACKALNYRTYVGKWDGDRPLSVYIDWNVINGKLTPSFVFDKPLLVKGDEVGNKLIINMAKLGIATTKDIRASNFSSPKFIYGL